MYYEVYNPPSVHICVRCVYLKNNKIVLYLASTLVIIIVLYNINQLYFQSHTEVIEITEYQGEKLGSARDFRENSIKGPQSINVTDYMLKVTGLVENPLEYTYEEVTDDFPSEKKVISLNCVEGWSVKALWEGIPIMELVEAANPDQEAQIIIFHAEDGYTTSLPVDYIEDNNIMLAFKINGITLPKENGFPLQLVAESKWGYKWCKWVEELKFSDDVNYEGFWESRGYSNEGDLG